MESIEIMGKKINRGKACKNLALKDFIITKNDEVIVARVLYIFVVCSLSVLVVDSALPPSPPPYPPSEFWDLEAPVLCTLGKVWNSKNEEMCNTG